MNGVLVDSNIIIDIITEDPQWFDWSSSVLTEYAEKTSLFINPIIYAEISLSYHRIEDLEEAVPSDLFKRSALPWEAAFLAGKAFFRYRKENRGIKSQALPDFFIGAHALISGFKLLTRDVKRFRTYFPNVKLITPEDYNR